MTWILTNNSALQFMLTNAVSKSLAAIAQIYAIYIFTKMHSPDDAAVIFILLGYTAWFQIFELGLAQTLQNRFNAKLISSSFMLKTLFIQLFFMWTVALIVLITPVLIDPLLPRDKIAISEETVAAFSIGSAILIVASNNVITQRLLLIFNQRHLGSIIMFSQSMMSILGLAFYSQIEKPNLVIAVVVYLGPQILVYLPVLARLMVRLTKNQPKRAANNVIKTLSDSLSFCGLGILLAIYPGLDYYFAAHYLNGEQVVLYHLTTRIFFISYITYFSFTQYRTKRLAFFTAHSKAQTTSSIFKDSVIIGIGSVLSMYCLTILLDLSGAFDTITSGAGINPSLLLVALIYFAVRVCRDVSLVIASALNKKKVLYLVLLVELVVAFGVMLVIVPRYRGIGIYTSMSFASLCSFLLLFYLSRNQRHQL